MTTPSPPTQQRNPDTPDIGAPDTETPEIPTPDVPETTPETAPEPETVSTPGGLPVVPAVTVGTTGMVATVSASGLAAGGGAALLLAGALITVPAAAVAMRAATSYRAAGGRRTPARAAASRSGGVPQQRAGAGRWSAAGTLGRSGGHRSGAGYRSGSGGHRTSGGRSGTGRSAGGTGLSTRARSVQQARKSAAAEAQRAGRTTTASQSTAARRQVADARRDARREARQQRRETRAHGMGGTGGRGWSLSKGGRSGGRSAGSRMAGGPGRGGVRQSAAGRLRGAARAAQTLSARVARLRRRGKDTAPEAATAGRRPGLLAARREAYRVARDQIRDRWRDRKRAQLEERARVLARTRALRLSAARYHARRVLAALVALPIGALSMAMWPWAKLINVRPPRWGRAVWRRLAKAAQDERTARDIAAYQDHDQAEADRARDERPAPPGVDRGRQSDGPVPTTKESTVTEPISTGGGFDFREAASDMLAQAQRSEPGGMMQILAQIETLPEALAALAETFAHMASTMSPENMPLHPEVTEALGDLHKQMVLCVDAGEAVGEVFRTYHEGDIARHTDGRTAEEMWDVSRQED
ncbi:hypothetical protein ABWJ92_38540 [Streptomyces sp. NPDC000609]|uniref:hypothetical protein n=1 Tax=Streptomyces sp. NPDC000609 TaxID=3160957 RepID=UPI0033921772